MSESLSDKKTNLLRGFGKLPGNLKGALTLLVAAAGFSVMVMLIKVAGERLHVTQILLVRQLIMMCIVMPKVINHFPGCLKTARLDLQLIRVVFALIAMLCGFYAVIHMPLADAVAIGFAKSFFVTIFAIIFLKEVVGIRRWAAVGVGFIGVLVMMRPGMSGFDPNSVLALIGAAAAGLVMVIIRKLSQTDKPVTTLSYQAFLVALCVAVPSVDILATANDHRMDVTDRYWHHLLRCADDEHLCLQLGRSICSCFTRLCPLALCNVLRLARIRYFARPLHLDRVTRDNRSFHLHGSARKKTQTKPRPLARRARFYQHLITHCVERIEQAFSRCITAFYWCFVLHHRQQLSGQFFAQFHTPLVK